MLKRLMDEVLLVGVVYFFIGLEISVLTPLVSTSNSYYRKEPGSINISQWNFSWLKTKSAIKYLILMFSVEKLHNPRLLSIEDPPSNTLAV